ncbi:MAG TPA: hypothetical protein VLS96_14220 [Nodosilinea sp.]|nr:hypothetical protein [Nodosilinea sp.]
MASHTTTAPQSAFKHHFDALVPLMLAEWPQLLEDNLVATEGDLDLAVAYISDETDRTQTLIRRQINELATLVKADAASLATNGSQPAEVAEAPSPSSTIETLLDDLESRTEHLIQELKAEMLPELEKRARGNLGQSLLIALGIGFVLGLILGGKRG